MDHQEKENQLKKMVLWIIEMELTLYCLFP